MTNRIVFDLSTGVKTIVPYTAEEEAEADARKAQWVIKQAELAKTQYQRDRAAEYPAIGDQLDALFKAGVFPADMAATIQAVKDKYPKG
jgi:hypothetical protein